MDGLDREFCELEIDRSTRRNAHIFLFYHIHYRKV